MKYLGSIKVESTFTLEERSGRYCACDSDGYIKHEAATLEGLKSAIGYVYVGLVGDVDITFTNPIVVAKYEQSRTDTNGNTGPDANQALIELRERNS